MFISESYIHFQDDLSHYADDDFVDISFDLKPFRRHSNTDNENMVKKTKQLSKSADLLYSKKKMNSNRGYDGDSDSDTNDTPTETTSSLARCEICQLDFMHDVLDTKDHKVFGVRKRKSKRKRKISTNLAHHHKTTPLHCVDFEDYKESTERMEVFAPDSERKWTLQYQYKDENDYPMLAKVIIGRGQNDQYPELNNIHLIQELKDYAQTEWRNKCLNHLKSRNKIMKECFSLVPSVSTCLFCFDERNNDILQNIQNDSQHIFHLPFCILDQCSTDINTDKMTKNKGQKNCDNISSNNPQLSVNEIQNLEKKHPLNGNEKPRNGLIDHTVSNQLKKKKGKLVRSNSLSEKVLTRFSRRKVDIELSNEFDDKCSIRPRANECSKEDSEIACAKLDDTVNVILMYAEKTQNDESEEHKPIKPVKQNTKKEIHRNGVSNKINTKTQNNTNEKLDNNKVAMKISEYKPEVQNERPVIKERRRHRRTLSEKIFRRKKSIEKEPNDDDDDDEEFVIIL